MKKIFLIIYLIFLNFFCNNLKALEFASTNLDSILNNSNTYYWLARSEYNHPSYLMKANLYLNKASEILHLKKNNLDSLSYKYYIQKINLFKNEINNALGVSTDNLNGKHSLYQPLFSSSANYEEFDDPMEIALESSLEKLINTNTISPSKPLKELMNYATINTYPNDENLTEVAAQLLLSSSNTYVISKHELYDILDKNTDEYTNTDYKKIASHFNVSKLGRFKITQLDKIDKLSYVHSEFELFTPEGNSSNSVTAAESIIIDKRGVKIKALFDSSLIYLIIPLIIILLIYFSHKQNIQYIFSFSSTLLTSLVFGYLLIYFLGFYAPSPDTFAGSTDSKLWILLTTIFLGGINSILSIMMNILIFKRSFFQDKIASVLFFFGSILGGVFALNYYNYFFIEENFSARMLIIQFTVFSISSIGISRNYLLWDRKKSLKFVLNCILYLIPTIVVYYFTIRDFNFSLLHLFVYITSILPALFSELLQKQFIHRDIISDVSDNNNKSILERIKYDINSYLRGEKVIPTDSIDDYNKISDFINKSGMVNILHFVGPLGIGKTSFFKEFIKENSDYNYYGDFDEPTGEKTQIPYEPFVEAFNESLDGDGIFYAADRYAKAVVKLGEQIESPVSSVLSLVNTSDKIEAPINEVIFALDSYFIKKIKSSSSSKSFIFCLDNFHWIENDINSKKLFIRLTTLADKYVKMYDVSFSFILLSNEDKIEKELSDKLTNNKFSYSKITKNSYSYFVGNNFIDDIFKNHIIDYLSRSELKAFFSDGINSSPKYILESIKFLLEEKLLVNEKNVLLLTEENWKDKLPFPNLISDLFDDIIKTLSKNQLRLLEAASFIGYKFDAKTLQSIWKLSRLEILDELRILENMGCVEDISSENDIYKFSSKPLFKKIKKSINQNQDTLSQIAKEYHISIANTIINDENFNENTYDLDILMQLADRFKFLKEDEKVKCFKLNLFAANRLFFNIGYDHHIKNYIKTYSELYGCEIDIKQKIKGLSLHVKYQLRNSEFNDIDLIISNLLPLIDNSEYFNIDNSNNKNDHHFHCEFYMDLLKYVNGFKKNKENKKTIIEIKKLEDVLSKKYLSDEMNIIRQFYKLIEENKELASYEHLEQNTLSLKLDTTPIYGRIINIIGREYKTRDDSKSLNLFIKRIQIIFSFVKPKLIITEDNLLGIVEDYFKKLSSEQQEDISYSLGAIADLYFHNKNIDLAYNYSKYVYNINRERNDIFGISIYGGLISNCYIIKKEKDYEKIKTHQETLYYAIRSDKTSSLISLLNWIQLNEYALNIEDENLNLAIIDFEKSYIESDCLNISGGLFSSGSTYYELFSKLKSNIDSKYIAFLNKINLRKDN